MSFIAHRVFFLSLSISRSTHSGSPNGVRFKFRCRLKLASRRCRFAFGAQQIVTHCIALARHSWLFRSLFVDPVTVLFFFFHYFRFVVDSKSINRIHFSIKSNRSTSVRSHFALILHLLVVVNLHFEWMRNVSRKLHTYLLRMYCRRWLSSESDKCDFRFSFALRKMIQQLFASSHISRKRIRCMRHRDATPLAIRCYCHDTGTLFNDCERNS